MKNIYLFFVCALSTFSLNAQDWSLFPYDSVYFMNPENHKDVLIPVIKSANSTEELADMLVEPELRTINIFRSSYSTNPYSNSHAFGMNLNDSVGYLTFNSLLFNERLNIHLLGQLNAVDTQSFYMDSTLYYMASIVDSIYFDSTLNDSIKVIEINLLDSQKNVNNFTNEAITNPIPPGSGRCLNGLFETMLSSENKRIVLGKNSGVLEIPNLAYYPYCKSYEKYKTVEEIKQLLLPPVLQVGDHFEVEYEHLNMNVPSQSHDIYKIIITGFSEDPQLGTYQYIARYWAKSVLAGIPPSMNTTVYSPFHIFSIPKRYDDYVFNGLNENRLGRSYFLSMTSHWGFPVLIQVGDHELDYFEAFGEAGDAFLHHITRLETSVQNISGYYADRCITYLNIGGVEYGNENYLHIEEQDDLAPLTVVIDQGNLLFNKEIKDHIDVFSVNGQKVYSIDQGISTQQITLPKLNSGIYFVRLDHYNQVLKVVYK